MVCIWGFPYLDYFTRRTSFKQLKTTINIYVLHHPVVVFFFRILYLFILYLGDEFRGRNFYLGGKNVIFWKYLSYISCLHICIWISRMKVLIRWCECNWLEYYMTIFVYGYVDIHNRCTGIIRYDIWCSDEDICVNVCMCTYMCICVYVYVYVGIYTCWWEACGVPRIYWISLRIEREELGRDGV